MDLMPHFALECDIAHYLVAPGALIDQPRMIFRLLASCLPVPR